jgi:signal transduction histidine kinase
MVNPSLTQPDWQRPVRPKAASGDHEPLYLLAFSLAVLITVALGLETRLDVALGIAGLITAAGGWLLSGRYTAALALLAVVAIFAAGDVRGVAISVRMVEGVITLVMAALSHLSASSLSSSRVALEQERQVRELTFLLEAAQSLAGSLDSTVIITTAVQATARRVSRPAPDGAPRASFHELDGDLLRIAVVQHGDRVEDGGTEYPLATNQAALGAMRSGRAALVRPDHLSGALLELAQRERSLVLAMAPVRSGSRLFGFLCAAAGDRNYFDRDELRRLEVLAHMAGLAIGNAEHLRREQAHSERTAALERTKSELLNLVSHELRGPLTVIRGYVSMLDEGAFGDVPNAYRDEVLPILDSKLTSMELLVEQTLEASRLEDSQLLLKKERLDFRSVAADAVQATQPLAGRRHRLTLEVPPVPVWVDGDSARLTTILTNLIDNAIKYSPDGGGVECRLTVAGQTLEFEVADHGLGIAAEHISKLFGRFGRIVTADNSHIPGTGLGLYLCQELARMHGGLIDVRSTVRRGSTFILKLPLTAPPAEAANGGQRSGGDAKRPRTKSAISAEKGASSSAGGS